MPLTHQPMSCPRPGSWSVTWTPAAGPGACLGPGLSPQGRRHLELKDGSLCCPSSSSRWSARFMAACNTFQSGPGHPTLGKPTTDRQRDPPRAVSGDCSRPPPSSLEPSSPCSDGQWASAQPQPQSQVNLKGVASYHLASALLHLDLSSWPWDTVSMTTRPEGGFWKRPGWGRVLC